MAYFDPALGGDGSTVTNADMANYGHVEHFIPALEQTLAVAQFVVDTAADAAASETAAAASAASALGAPGTNATSTTSLTIGTGSKSLTIQTGKAYAVGQVVVIAYTTSPSNQMTGVITSYNSGTGALVVDVQQTLGSGTQTAWTVSLGALVSSTLPSQTGNNGKFLTTNGTSASWADALTPSGNLSGLANTTTARANLGLTIGTHVQAQDTELSAIAGLTSAADRLPYFTGSGTAALATFTAAGRALVDDADASAQRTTLGLAIGVNVQAYDAKLGSFSSLTGAADKLAYFTGASTMAVTDISAFARTFLDDANAGAVRTTIGAAASGVNNDITELGGLTTPVARDKGGTGETTVVGARNAFGIAGARNLYGRFACGAGAPTKHYGDGFSLSRNSQGDYTITLDEAASGAHLWSWRVQVSGNSANATENCSAVEKRSVTQTTATATFLCYEGTSALFDPDWVNIEIHVNS